MDTIDSIVVCDAVRTPFCHAQQFSEETPASLFVAAVEALLRRNPLPPNLINGVIAGTVMHDSRWSNIARMIAVESGLSIESADYSVQGNCNSGFVAIMGAIGDILMGNGTLYIAGGTDQMSCYGFRVRDRRTGRLMNGGVFTGDLLTKKEKILNDILITDGIQETLSDFDRNFNMAEVAEIMANFYGISREQQDLYARESLTRALAAVESGVMNRYIVPVGSVESDSYPNNRKRMLKREDAFSRATAIYDMDDNELSPEFFVKKNSELLKPLGITSITPTVTMYNATVPGDGAGAMIITTESRAKELGLTPKLRIISWEKVGVNPILMGIGPAVSTHRLFNNPKTERARGLTFDQVDIIELHEAFAAQVLSVFSQSKKEFGMEWNPEKINRYGGSLAYTHPLGATNSRLVTNVLARFDQQPSARYALTASCAGGGMGASILFERA